MRFLGLLLVATLSCCFTVVVSEFLLHPSTVHGHTDHDQGPGDTLSLIATKFGVSLDHLEKANPQISSPDLIYPGQILNVPDDSQTPRTRSHGFDSPSHARTTSTSSTTSTERTSTYVVKPGDTLFDIAQVTSLSLECLLAANPGIRDADKIEPGMVIIVPDDSKHCGATKPASPSSTSSSLRPPSSNTITRGTSSDISNSNQIGSSITTQTQKTSFTGTEPTGNTAPSDDASPAPISTSATVSLSTLSSNDSSAVSPLSSDSTTKSTSSEPMTDANTSIPTANPPVSSVSTTWSQFQTSTTKLTSSLTSTVGNNSATPNPTIAVTTRTSMVHSAVALSSASQVSIDVQQLLTLLSSYSSSPTNAVLNASATAALRKAESGKALRILENSKLTDSR